MVIQTHILFGLWLYNLFVFLLMLMIVIVPRRVLVECFEVSAFDFSTYGCAEGICPRRLTYSK
jgi:hypothetical protein